MEQKPTRKYTQYSIGSLELLATPVTITAYQGGGKQIFQGVSQNVSFQVWNHITSPQGRRQKRT